MINENGEKNSSKAVEFQVALFSTKIKFNPVMGKPLFL
jgi:hypothetical protein